MSKNFKDQNDILQKLGIENLNPMQEEALDIIDKNASVVILSPTGTGKTLAFLLPLLQQIDISIKQVQALILVPSRELAIQIEQVAREMGSGYKVNAVYGGRAFSKDKIELNQPPAILIGTPGRVGDHLRRQTFSVDHLRVLILDEFDKSLETGFEGEMREIIAALPGLKKRILTSATQQENIPQFAGVKDPVYIDYLDQAQSLLETKTISSPTKDKLNTLVKLLKSLGNKPGIIFCNYKETIDEVNSYLRSQGIGLECFHGGMEQKDRERSLIKFRNGTSKLILATDLAARGIDVPEIEFIIHYQLPHSKQEFIHRNGRTARMNQKGVAYILHWEQESLPAFIETDKDFKIPEKAGENFKDWITLFISGGRKDKISKGDIAGLFLKQGNLQKDELGNIELKHDCAFVSVPAAKEGMLIQVLNNSRLKNKKVRISKI